MKLRDYQTDILKQLQASTSADLVQLDTGGGKLPSRPRWLPGRRASCWLRTATS
ncbi:hypothetical protein ACFSVK_02730 [Azorhizophilus paspali]|uniref:hypothetical protein n=1 Tax=Azorhizophilus paspali TaxID=69963 RepID=UPI0036444977